MKLTLLAICIFISLFSFLLASLHLLRKRHSTNAVFGLTNLFGVIFFGLYGISIFFDLVNSIPVIKLSLLTFALGIVIFAFHFAVKYPRWETPLSSTYVYVSSAYGVIVISVLFFDVYLVQLVHFKEFAKNLIEKIYSGTIAIYIVASIVVLLNKTKNLKNVSFRKQVVLLAHSYSISGVILIVSSLVALRYSNENNYVPWGVAASYFLWSIIVNHALMHEKELDLGSFYRLIAFWTLFFMILAIPSYFIFKLGKTEFTKGNPIPIEAIAVIIFLYLFLMFRFGRPLFYKILAQKDLAFESQVNEFLEKVALISSEEKGEAYWDLLLENAILPLESNFGINAATLYIKSSKEKFELAYGFGGKLSLGDILPGDDLYKCIVEYGRVLHVSYFYTDEALETYSTVKDKMENAKVASILPFYNQQRELIGILYLGLYRNNVYYPWELINFLEKFRIQFELSLANILMLEQIKDANRQEHESLVIRSIKKRILPTELPTISGIRISSFHLDGSTRGGDYFDSVLIGKSGVGMFMCDASDTGVESGVLLLEIYSILHNQPEKMETPDKMLNAMNWVITTSRYTNRYVPAIYCIYRNTEKQLLMSGAAFNPLIIYSLSKDEFIENDLKGIPLGVDKNYNYDLKAFKISESIVGFIYSDGIISAMNRKGLPYSIGRIKDIIRLNKEDTPSMLARKIYTDFMSYNENVKPQLDASLIIFKIII